MSQTEVPPLSGRERVETVAHGTNASTEAMIREVSKSVLGEVRSEMLAEMRALLKEGAQKALDGRPDDAGDPDPGNEHAWDWKSQFRSMLGDNGERRPREVPQGSKLRTIARSMFYLHKSGHPHMALETARKRGESEEDLGIMARALNVDDFSSGGALFQGELADEVLPELLATSSLTSDPALNRITFNGSIDFPYISSGGTGRWVAESGGANASDIATQRITLTEKKCTIIVPASQKFMRSVSMAERFIVNSLTASLATEIDSKCLRSTGGSSEPVGLRYLANSGNRLNVNGSVNAANVEEDMLRLVEAILDSDVNVTAEGGRYLFAPRIWRYLWTLRNNGESVFRPELAMGRIAGYQVRPVTTSLPTNLAVTDTSETEILFYEVPGLIFGLAEDFQVSMSDTAAYLNSSGTVTAAFSRDEVVWKISTAFDLNDRNRGHGISVLIDSDWT